MRPRVQSRYGLKLGDRVQLSSLGREREIRMGWHNTGIVTGFGRDHGVYVVPDGNKSANKYHEDFIEAAKAVSR